MKTAAVDLVFDHRRSGLILATSEEMLEGRKRHGEFWIPSEKVEFAYLLAKKSWKGNTPERQSIRLKQLAEILGQPEAERIAATVFSGNSNRQAVRACLNESLATDVVGARKEFWKTAWTRRPLQSVNTSSPIPRGWLGAKSAHRNPGRGDGSGRRRQKHRNYWPHRIPGTWLLAPAQIISLAPASAFRKARSTHQSRPARKARARHIVVHGLSVGFFPGSLGRLHFQSAPRARQIQLCNLRSLFPRCLVDPRRYRYGGPTWYAKLLARAIPEPDLVILLDADEFSIAARKCEVPSAGNQNPVAEISKAAISARAKNCRGHSPGHRRHHQILIPRHNRIHAPALGRPHTQVAGSFVSADAMPVKQTVDCETSLQKALHVFAGMDPLAPPTTDDTNDAGAHRRDISITWNHPASASLPRN